MKTEEVRKMILKISDTIVENEELLCKLDSFIGDGDHGVTAARGFGEVKKKMEQESFSSPAQVLTRTGEILSESMGGAIGPIIGALFTGGAANLEEQEEFGAEEFGKMFVDGLNMVKMIGGAKEGDRTLVDALSPASAAFNAGAAEGKSLKECMADAAQAAQAGAEATKDMAARKGRAKFLGEKSRGYVDAGATTMSLVVRAMSDYMEREEE